MFRIDDKINIEKALLLAPMEDITDIAYRKLMKELGADVVYTEFVNCEGLVRQNEKTHKKLKITDEERPVGIQIYGDSIESMVGAAKIAEKENPDIIDINAGCWVRKVAGRGAGAGLLKDPDYLVKMVTEIVNAVDKPVTVKTRIGWDEKSIIIVDIAKRLEDAGIKALTLHCRTRSQAHDGEPDWTWINKVKEVVDMPVVLNGGVFTAEDCLRAFEETKADGVMIARGAIQNPWLFLQCKEILSSGKVLTRPTFEDRINTALKQLSYSLEVKEERRAVIEFRKYYTGYLKGLRNSSKAKQKLMKVFTYKEVEDILYDYLNELLMQKDE